MTRYDRIVEAKRLVDCALDEGECTVTIATDDLEAILVDLEYTKYKLEETE